MDHSNAITVIGLDGVLGWIAADEMPLADESTAADRDVTIHLPAGQVVLAPVELLMRRPDGSYYLPLSRSQVEPRPTEISNRNENTAGFGRQPDQGQPPAGRQSASTAGEVQRSSGSLSEVEGQAAGRETNDETATNARRETLMVIPLIEENVAVGKRRTTRPVRIRKSVDTHIEHVDDPGYREEIQVEHVPLNLPVDNAPAIRQEGDTTVIPLVEEVLVVEKRLVVREEIRVTLKKIPNPPMDVPLRAEKLEVDETADAEAYARSEEVQPVVRPENEQV